MKNLIKSFFPLISDVKENVECDLLTLGEDSSLYNPANNSIPQQGDPEIRIYKDVVIWPDQSVATKENFLIPETFLDPQRIPRVINSKYLRKYPVISVGGGVASIDYVFSGTNYFHQFVDSFPRTWALRHNSIDSASDITVVINRKMPTEWLQFMYWIFPEIKILKVPKLFRIACDRYFHLPFLSKDRVNHSPHDSQTSAGFIPNEYLSFFRTEVKFRLGVDPGQSCGPFIYVSRGEARVRRLLNEAQVTERLASLGFTVISPGRMTIREQVIAFQNARVIVGLHGAAFTNLLYCNSGGSLIEIFPSNNQAHHYYSLHATVLGMGYRAVYLNEESVHSDCSVPIDELVRVVKEFM